MRKLKNLIGHKFGRLTVIKRITNGKRGAIRWLCQCDCGKQTQTSSGDLKNRNAQSCGCLKLELLRGKIGDLNHRFKNLVGQKFGRLIVLRQGKTIKRQIYWVCQCDCGNQVDVRGVSLTKKKGQTKSCGCLVKDSGRTGALNPFWKGGRRQNNHGYIFVLDKTSHHASRGYALEHLIVMDKILGRPVDIKTESVHHKNGIRSDNRPENLELRVKYHGKGQSVEDRIKYAVEILSKYEPSALSEYAITCNKL